MTPQPRHIDTAINIVTEHVCYVLGDDPMVQAIAAALADAENRAAWDVIKMAHATWAIPLDLVESVAREVTAKYGPRPLDAAKEVGNE